MSAQAGSLWAVPVFQIDSSPEPPGSHLCEAAAQSSECARASPPTAAGSQLCRVEVPVFQVGSQLCDSHALQVPPAVDCAAVGTAPLVEPQAAPLTPPRARGGRGNRRAAGSQPRRRARPSRGVGHGGAVAAAADGQATPRGSLPRSRSPVQSQGPAGGSRVRRGRGARSRLATAPIADPPAPSRDVPDAIVRLPGSILSVVLLERTGPYLPDLAPPPRRGAQRSAWRAAMTSLLPEGRRPPADTAFGRVLWSLLVRNARAEADALAEQGHGALADQWRRDIQAREAARSDSVRNRTFAWVDRRDAEAGRERSDF